MPGSDETAGPLPGSARSLAFPRAYRLKRRRLIRPLFDRSRTDTGTVAVGCIRLLYRTVPREETGYDVPWQIGFAPGRTPRAVQRNRIRRLLREVYRVHQHILVDLFLHRDETLTVMVLYRGRPEAASPRIMQDLPRALTRLADRFSSGLADREGQ
ncbi:MAG: ribonuclease P protein component [Rhodothermales bacterium]